MKSGHHSGHFKGSVFILFGFTAQQHNLGSMAHKQER
jgi:hypothetical protein